MRPYSLPFGQVLIPQPDGSYKRGGAITLPLEHITHTHFMGMTGYGKSSLIAWLCTLLIMQGIGVFLIDPAGTLARQVLCLLIDNGYFERIPNAFERLLYLDIPGGHRQERYFAGNILRGDYDPYTAADVVLEGFKRVWPTLQDGSAVNIEAVTQIGGYVLAYHKLPLLPYLERLYTDRVFQHNLVSSIPDKRIQDHFRALNLEPTERKAADIALTTLKREFLLSFSPMVSYPLSQPDNLLDFTRLLEQSVSALLSFRITASDAKRLLGCLLTQQAESVAKTRGELTKEQAQKRYVIVIDEMQNFLYQSGDALGNMLAETRKANLFVWLIHQYKDQIPEPIQPAFGQTDTKVVFKLDYDDSQVAARQLGFPIDPYKMKQRIGDPFSLAGTHKQYFSEDEQWSMHARKIQHLGQQEMYVKFPDKTPDKDPDRLRTGNVSYEDIDMQRVEEIEQEYMRRYFRPKAEIDREIEETLARFGASQVNIPDEKLPKSQQAEPQATPPPPERRVWKDSSPPKRPPTSRPKRADTQPQAKPTEQETAGLPFIKPIVLDDEVTFDMSDVVIPEDDDE